MLSEENISLSHYFTLGIRLFILCGILILVYANYFLEPINNTYQYSEDRCTIKSISIVNVTIDCIDEQEIVKVVTMPCILAKADTHYNKDIIFYRNYAEKIRAVRQNVNCSYLPLNCQNDPIYTKRMLTTYHLSLFPPQNFKLKCYVPTPTQTNSSKTKLKYSADALLYLPDHLGYQCSLTILVFGTIMGILLIVFGFKFEIRSPFIFKSIFEIYMAEIQENNFKFHKNNIELDYLEKIGYSEPPVTSTCTLDKERHLENIELTNFSQSQKNNLTINDNINRNRSLSHEDFQKLSNAGYHFGRVGYPSCSKFSYNASLRSSMESICHSIKDDSDRSYDGPMFHLDVKRNLSGSDRSSSPDPNYPNLHIPQSIVEEDENLATVSSFNDMRVRKPK